MGHQNRRAVRKNKRCSASWIIGSLRPIWYSAGECQAHRFRTYNAQLTGSRVKAQSTRRAGEPGARRNPALSLNWLGNPHRNAGKGSAKRMPRGAIIRSSRCCTICMLKRLVARESMGDISATPIAESPSK